MKKQVLFLVIFISALTVKAQQNLDKNPYIDVRGKAEMNVAPDIVNLKISLHKDMEGREKVNIDRLEANLLNVIKNNDIDKSQLTIDDMDGVQEKVRRKTTGLMTSKQYNLRITDLSTLDNLLYDLQTIKNIRVQQGKVEFSNLEEIKDKMYVMAVKSAVHKADVLLSAAGAQRGKVIWMEEGYNQFTPRPVMVMQKRAMAMPESASFEDNNVGLTENEFRFEVRVRFAIQ